MSTRWEPEIKTPPEYQQPIYRGPKPVLQINRIHLLAAFVIGLLFWFACGAVLAGLGIGAS